MKFYVRLRRSWRQRRQTHEPCVLASITLYTSPGFCFCFCFFYFYFFLCSLISFLTAKRILLFPPFLHANILYFRICLSSRIKN